MTSKQNEARTSVVVVNYGSHSMIAESLDAESLATAGLTTVIVDNFSSAAERNAVQKLCSVRGWLFEPSENKGFGAGMNRGVARAISAGCEAIVALNPDANADAATLAALGRHVTASDRELVSPAMVDSVGGVHFRGAQVSMATGQIRSGWATEDDDPTWRNWLSGACLAYSARVHRELGGFDETYFLYWEDVDLSRRAAESGMSLTLRKDLVVIHDEGGTHGAQLTRAKSPLYYYYNTRNRLRFAIRHCSSRRELAAWIASTPRQSLRIWLRGGRRQLLTQPRGALMTLRGTLAGLGEALLALLTGPGGRPS